MTVEIGGAWIMTQVDELMEFKEYTELGELILRKRIENVDPKVVGDMVQVSALAATYIAVLDEPSASEEMKVLAYLALVWAVRGAGL